MYCMKRCTRNVLLMDLSLSSTKRSMEALLIVWVASLVGAILPFLFIEILLVLDGKEPKIIPIHFHCEVKMMTVTKKMKWMVVSCHDDDGRNVTNGGMCFSNLYEFVNFEMWREFWKWAIHKFTNPLTYIYICDLWICENFGSAPMYHEFMANKFIR